MKAWMRKLEVTLYSQNEMKKMSFGNISQPDKEPLSITVDCYKYINALQDTCTIKLMNLTYSEIVRIIDGKFYKVKVDCGYKDANVVTVFQGGIFYVSNALGDKKTNSVILICTSELVAKFGQRNINLTLSSNVNAYTALQYLNKRFGIDNAIVSEKLKNITFTNGKSISGSFSSWINTLAKEYDYLITADSTKNAMYSIRSIEDILASEPMTLKSDYVDLSGGYPRMTNDGVNLTILPTLPLICTDAIRIDNSILDIGVEDKNSALRNYGLFLESSNRYGTYVIFEMEYHLSSRQSSFSCDMKCKNYNLIQSLPGGGYYG